MSGVRGDSSPRGPAEPSAFSGRRFVPLGGPSCVPNWPVTRACTPPVAAGRIVASMKSHPTTAGGRTADTLAASAAREGVKRTTSRSARVPFATVHTPTTLVPSNVHSSGSEAPGTPDTGVTRDHVVSAAAEAGTARRARRASDARRGDRGMRAPSTTCAAATGGSGRRRPVGAGRRTPRASGRSRPRRRSAATRRCARASRSRGGCARRGGAGGRRRRRA